MEGPSRATERSGTASARWSAGLLLLLGIATVATGGYFVALRPPLLPEDVRLTGVASESLPPAFNAWLSVVFRTWGGFMVGFGIVLATSGMSLWRRDARWSRWGLASASALSFGSFLLSNIQIGSDFVWFIGALFALAAACSVSVIRLGRQGPSIGRPSNEGLL